MKKILFVCALMGSAMVMAQSPKCKDKSPEARAIHKAMEYRDVLRLDEKQFNKMYKVYLADFTAMQADTTLCCKDKKEMTKEQCEAKKAAMKKVLTNRQNKMKKVLDDAQYALWLEMEKAKCEHHKPSAHHGPAMHPGHAPMCKDKAPMCKGHAPEK